MLWSSFTIVEVSQKLVEAAGRFADGFALRGCDRIDYDEEMNKFRGEILGLFGGADFYGSSPEELRREFKKSLEVFLEVCREKGTEPGRQYSGKFNLRIPPELHEKLAMIVEAQGKSLSSLAQEALQGSVSA